ncbi:MAG: ATP-binding domain-containing protein [Gammaproteobacteria bacterium]|nr:ATP-binding domain-containing protein [Gammaproteobacteria bacterium]
MRVGELSPEEMELMQGRSEVRTNPALFAKATLLCARKEDYSTLNCSKVNELNSPKVVVYSHNEPEWVYRSSSENAGNLVHELRLCKGMRVMLTNNLNLEAGLTNGSVGTIVGIVYLSRETDRTDIPTVLVQFDGYKGDKGVLDDFGISNVYPVSAIKHTWYVNKIDCHRTQLPLMPAYAISIHKSQGLTLERVVLDLELTEHSGRLTYTALSRARRLTDIMFRGAKL